MRIKYLVVPEGTVMEYMQFAADKGIAQIIDGIPDKLSNKLTEDMLPYIYEEEIQESKLKPHHLIYAELQEQQLAQAEAIAAIFEMLTGGEA